MSPKSTNTNMSERDNLSNQLPSLSQVLKPWEYKISGGFTLRGWHSEPSNRPVIHFIHGNGFCGLTYEAVLAPLLEHFDLFISDAQGHGDSDAGGAYVGWNRAALYASEVWSHFSKYWANQQKIACGHSYGSVLSSVIMSKQPELFDRAILLDPTYAPPLMSHSMVLMSELGFSKNFPLSKQAMVRSTSWPDEAALWEYFHQRGVFQGWEDRCLKSYLSHAMARLEDGSIALKCPPEIEAAIFASYPKWLWRNLKSIDTPVDVLYGDATFDFILKAIPKLATVNKNYTMHAMTGGHCFMQESPDQTSDRILGLLKHA